MNIDLVFPVLPPSLDGIGDHTAHLARSLTAQGCTVRVLTAQKAWTPLSEVTVQRTFHLQRRRGILDLIDVYRSTPHPDWLLLQFEQFSYGRWGLNPFLPLAIQHIKHIAPEMKIAVMFHEDYMPARGIKSAIMSSWQRLQFFALGRLADVALFSTELWTHAYARWFPHTSVRHLPVGSNIPYVEANRNDERARLGIDPETVVIGLFGSAHPSRLLTHVEAAVTRCLDQSLNVRLLYIGADGQRVREVLGPDAPVFCAGPLPGDDVSRCFAAMDVYLAPFSTGVSTRRGSFLVGLQHSLATVTTRGDQTGPWLAEQHRQGFLAPERQQAERFTQAVVSLVQSPNARHGLGRAGHTLYKNYFDWPTLARRLLEHLLAPVPTPRKHSLLLSQ
jgi:glycosyltransferase involved in cell wall biosynthesis